LVAGYSPDASARQRYCPVTMHRSGVCAGQGVGGATR
jgi:hypothetical protein